MERKSVPTWDVRLDLLSCDERQHQQQEAGEGVHDDERGVSRQRVSRGCDATTTTTTSDGCAHEGPSECVRAR